MATVRSRSSAHTVHSNGTGTRTASPVPDHLGVPAAARRTSITSLTQILADLSALRALYKHFHWRVTGRRFIMLHELFDKHAEQTLELVDAVAERIQMLGGEATAWPGDIAKTTQVRPPDSTGHKHSEQPDRQIRELLEAHRIVLEAAHAAAAKADDSGDAGTNDLLSGQVIRTGQLQAWFIGEHLEHTGND